VTTNRDIYSGVEFRQWAGRTGLEPMERHLIEHYLERDEPVLEVGTGAGRILRSMRDLGYSQLTGLDFVPGFIDEARRLDKSHEIRFMAGDARAIGLPDRSMNHVLLLQQLLSFIDTVEDREHALREAHRVMRPGGTALISVLWFDGRSQSRVHGAHGAWLAALRRLRGHRRSIQSRPWLKHGGVPNLGALVDRGPYVYWYRTDELASELRAAGLVPIAVGSRSDLAGGLVAGFEKLRPEAGDTMLYVVCRRPSESLEDHRSPSASVI
jgi:SAM-dependent methyltransferase